MTTNAIDDPELAPFFEGCRAGELRIPRCAACGTWNWYPPLFCKSCGTAAPAWTRVSGRAKLFTWTIVHRAFLDDFAARVPYLTALVELEEDPSLRLATLLVDVEREDLHLDLLLEVVFGKKGTDLFSGPSSSDDPSGNRSVPFFCFRPRR